MKRLHRYALILGIGWLAGGVGAVTLVAGEGIDLVPRGLEAPGSGSPINVSAITEVTAAGRAAAQSTAAQPLYYLPHDGGLAGEGIPIGGERPPDASVLAGTLKSALAANHYLAADAAHSPSLLIFYRWGSFNREVHGMPELERVNLVERAALVGGTQFGLQVLDAMNANTLEFFRNRDFKTTVLMQQVTSNLYFVVVSAYDLAAARRGERVLLWRTKLSTIARGVTMDESLPELAAVGAPYFGRDMTEAAWIETRLPEARVEVGEPTVTGYLSAPLPANFTPDGGDLEGIPKQQIGLRPF